MKISDILNAVKSEARLDIAGVNPQVVVNPEFGSQLDLNKLKVSDKRWHQIDNVVAIFADLKGSSNLSLNNQKATVASIYTGSTGGLVSIFNSFKANYIQVQGDGVLAVFWGQYDFERAMCAALTAKTFGATVKHLIEDRKNQSPFESGYRIGVSSSSILVKKFGGDRSSQQSLIWSGDAVNFAVKASEDSSNGSLVITNSVWDKIRDNEYLSSSCECSTLYGQACLLWDQVTISNIKDERESEGYERSADWNEEYLDIFCAAIMQGDKTRKDPCMEKLRKNYNYENYIKNPFRSNRTHLLSLLNIATKR